MGHKKHQKPPQAMVCAKVYKKLAFYKHAKSEICSFSHSGHTREITIEGDHKIQNSMSCDPDPRTHEGDHKIQNSMSCDPDPRTYEGDHKIQNSTSCDSDPRTYEGDHKIQNSMSCEPRPKDIRGRSQDSK